MCHRVQVGTKALKATGSDLVEEPNEGSLAFRPPALVEMYDRQVYLSHLQARALYEGSRQELERVESAGTANPTGSDQAGRATAGELTGVLCL